MNFTETTLKPRDIYLERLKKFQDNTDLIKVITGIRRCGKSTLLKLMQQHLLQSGVTPEQILALNCEKVTSWSRDAAALYAYIESKVVPGKRLYLFLDELQNVPKWEDVANSCRVGLDCDVYITGSNAYLLSSDYATHIAGRFKRIHMQPLSFKEFILFLGYTISDSPLFHLPYDKAVLDADGKIVSLDDLFERYLTFGGLPGIVLSKQDADSTLSMIADIYSSILMKDIVDRGRRIGEKQPEDTALLNKIISFLVSSLGSNVSCNSIANTLVSAQLLPKRSAQGKPSVATVVSYLDNILDAYLFYEAKRFNIKGKEELRTLSKYYIADLGIRSYIISDHDLQVDIGHLIENVVFLELIMRGYTVKVGKFQNREIDFVAIKHGEKLYIQVTDNMYTEEIRERELTPLRAVRDATERILLTRQAFHAKVIDGIRIVRIIDFLLS